MVSRCRIGCPSEKEAMSLSRSLVEKRLVAGTIITSGICHYRWEGEIVEKIYRDVSGFTVKSRHNDIISYVTSVHTDQCPVIAFTAAETTEDMEIWVRKSVI